MEINKDVSYLIGLFQTDGNIYDTTRNRGKAVIELSIKDEDIINKIKDIIPYNYTITKRKRITKIINKNKDEFYYEKEYVGIRVCDLDFRKFLNFCGVISGKKSEIIKPPLHLENLSIPDYIRGLYDGDGSLGMTGKDLPFVSIVTSSPYIASFIMDYIKNITNKPRKNVNPNKRDHVYNIVITKEDAIKFCENIYYKNCLSMKRKYEKSLIVKNWVRPKKMKNIVKKKFWDEDKDNFILNHNIEESINFLNKSKNSIQMRICRLKNNFMY